MNPFPPIKPISPAILESWEERRRHREIVEGAMPCGPGFRPSGRAAARLAGIAASIAIAGCEKPSSELAWYDQPRDPQVYALILDRCLAKTHGPQTTTYNDWSEAIGACGEQAAAVSRYCPESAFCSSGSVSREDVRAVLATSSSPNGNAQ